MKICFLLILIASLFAASSLDKNVFEQKQDAEQSLHDLPVHVEASHLGEFLCHDIYIGANFSLEKHDVISLWPNYQERDEQEQPAAIFSRSEQSRTDISEIWLNGSNILTSKDTSWNIKTGQTPDEYFKNLSRKLIENNDNIVGAKYKIIPIDENNFVLEDILLVYKKEYSWSDVRIKIESWEANQIHKQKTTEYKLRSV